MKEAVSIAPSMTERQETVRAAFQKERKKLFDFIRRRVPGKADAEDILQDVFFQLTHQLEPIEQVTSWLFTVARNKITDRYRKKKPESLEKYQRENEDISDSPFLRGFFDPQNTPEDDLTRSLIWDAVEEALQELPKEQREVFVLHEIDGKDFKEIAEMKGVSVNTLLSRKRYAVLHLREKLKTLYDELLNN